MCVLVTFCVCESSKKKGGKQTHQVRFFGNGMIWFAKGCGNWLYLLTSE